MLWPEGARWSQDIGVVDAPRPRASLDADGRFRIDVVREAIAARLPAVPRSGR
jgi:hypothetical protein